MKEQVIDSMRSLLSVRPIAWLAAQLLYPIYRNRKSLCRAVERYLPPAKKADPRAVRRAKKAAFYNKAVYKVTYEEFFQYGFSGLKHERKKTYIGDLERSAICDRIVSDYTYHIFNDKYETFKRFRPYFRRESICVGKPEDREAFDRFVSEHKDLFVKPYNESLGNGVFVYDLNDPANSPDALFERILSKGPHVIEDRIRQSAKMASLHPQSVNTVRILTKLEKDGTPVVVDSFFKIGRAKACVDNGRQGGILAAVDAATGTVTTVGITNDLEEFAYHPDTGCQIVGFRFPQWNEARKLAEELAGVVPEQRLVGWDLAHTDEGWVVVEGNCKPMLCVWQLTRGKGWRPTAEKYLSEWMN